MFKWLSNIFKTIGVVHKINDHEHRFSFNHTFYYIKVELPNNKKVYLMLSEEDFDKHVHKAYHNIDLIPNGKYNKDLEQKFHIKDEIG